jgi:dTDP-4-dehydrorhamnose reductase
VTLRILVIGSDTPLGDALVRILSRRERDFVALPRSECRWKGERQAKKTLRRSACDIAVDTRIQSAADGGIRVREKDILRSRWLSRASQTMKLPFMHLSCARVFSGNAGRPYRETDEADGDSSIAQLLIAAETEVREHCERFINLRLGPVFAPTGINVITHMLSQLQEGSRMQFERRQKGCPVPVEDAARVVSGMLDQYSCGLEAWGDFHYCSTDATDCFEFAEVLLAAASQYLELAPDVVNLAEVNAGGQPLDRSLDCTLIRNTFAIKQQSWRASVAGQVRDFYSEGTTEVRERVESH